MKRILLVLLSVLLLAGCSKSSNVKAITENLQFSAQLCYYNECYEADTQIDGKGNITFNITSPEDIAGLQLSFSGEEVTATYNGMEYTAENPQLFGAFGRVNEIFGHIRENNVPVNVDDNSYSAQGNINGEYDLTVSTAGIPIELEADPGDLEMSFRDIKIVS